MNKSRLTKQRIVGIPKEQETGLAVPELCHNHGVSSPTFYKRKAKYGGLNVAEARKLKMLKVPADGNAKLKRMPRARSSITSRLRTSWQARLANRLCLGHQYN
jgi:putative transposase